MRKFIIFTMCLFPAILAASNITGTIKRRLDGQKCDYAIVKLIKTPENEVVKSVVTDDDGNYYIGNVPPGIYKIEASKPDYYKNILFDLEVEPSRTYTCNIDLLLKAHCREKYGLGKSKKRHGKDKSDYCFMIGGIEVQSHGEEIIPEEAVTTRKISSGEIEHLQATSLGDVLNLVPGIEKSQNPGLSKSSLVGIRSVTVDGTQGLLESFGSTVIVDGNEVSSGANAMGSGRRGVDLRTIPADNIESVEVISGIPSAEYGNFSNGIIKVENKSGYVQPKLKAKINPDTKTASFSDGFKLKKGLIDYHLNYGYSERDLREKGDEYHRIYGKVNYSRPFLDDKLDTRMYATYTRTIDSDKPTGIYKLKDYDKGYRASTSFSFDYEPLEDREYNGLLTMNLNRRKDFYERLVTDQVVIPEDTTIDYYGEELSDTMISQYIGKRQTLGYEWRLNGRIKRKQEFNFWGQTHDITTGLEFKYEENTGDGLNLHPYWNYYGFYSSRHSYSFDDYSNLQEYNLFFQDNITGQMLGKKYNLQLGLRYSAFNPTGLGLANSFLETRHGEYLCPRINLQYFINDDLRFRIGAGKSTKSISLAYIYQAPEYYEYLNEDSVKVEESHTQQNPDLKAYTTNKYEASVDWRPSDAIGFSLTGYYSTNDDRPLSVTYPFGYEIKPDTITAADYSIYENRGWKDSYGTELTVRTKRVYNLQLKMNFTYRYSEVGRSGTIYDNRADTSAGESFWYNPAKTWREKFIIDYQLNYVSQRLGVWVTLDAQQIPMDNKKEVYNSAEYTKEVDEVEHTFHQGMTYWWDDELFEYGGRWLFNLRITKSLSQNMELSLYINNIFDDRALWLNPFRDMNREQNPEIYYGLEVSTRW